MKFEDGLKNGCIIVHNVLVNILRAMVEKKTMGLDNLFVCLFELGWMIILFVKIPPPPIKI